MTLGRIYPYPGVSFSLDRRIRFFIHSETSESSHATDFGPITMAFGGNVLKASEGLRTAIIRSIGSVALPLVMAQTKHMPPVRLCPYMKRTSSMNWAVTFVCFLL